MLKMQLSIFVFVSPFFENTFLYTYINMIIYIILNEGKTLACLFIYFFYFLYMYIYIYTSELELVSTNLEAPSDENALDDETAPHCLPQHVNVGFHAQSLGTED